MAKPVSLIVTPAPPGSRAGNRMTARRWANILRALGWRVEIANDWTRGSFDLFIALHARKSHRPLAAFRARYPGAPAVLALTGTDLYRDLRVSAEANASLELAQRLIVLQQEGRNEITPALRDRVRVIHQSAVARAAHRPPRNVFRICVLGHLRHEKDPLRTAYALRHLGSGFPVEVVQAGGAIESEYADEARRLMDTDRRYRWVGELAHWKALRLLAASHVLVVSSRMEGGAHVISEAIVHGVPVFASDIPGNRGMLGADYGGYFELEDERAIAELVRRTNGDAAFLAELSRAIVKRRPMFSPQRETDCWRALLDELELPVAACAQPKRPVM
jgi:putative glycosyltransferase (TIGR04348 family)